MKPRPPFAALLLAAALAVVPAAQAAPGEESATDAMRHLLIDRGLVPVVQETQTLVRQVRDGASDLVFAAMNFLGVPYRRGGSSPEAGFDCSGFTRHVFERTVGLVLPHRADQQANGAGLATISRDQLAPGDLVFFNTMRRAFSHVGIYVGDGKFIHAPRSGGQVRVEDMRESYWSKRFNGARRADIADIADIGGMAAAAEATRISARP